MINMTWMLRIILATVHAFVDEFTSKKMHTYGEDYQEFLLQHIDYEKLEERYGGEFNIVSESYFPPSLI